MPSLGADMEAGTLVEWVKHPGDTVRRGDIIAVVDTQKGAIEIEVFEDGVLEKTVVDPGEKVPVGTVLAVIRGGGPERPTVEGPVAPPPAPPVAMPPLSTTTPPVLERPGRVRVSPMARKLAADLGIDLARVAGTGAQGSIMREDVERAAAALKAPVSTPTTPPTDRTGAMRAAIGAAMARSKREIPHYYLSTTIDLSAAVAWLRAENEQAPDHGTPAASCSLAQGRRARPSRSARAERLLDRQRLM